MNLKAKNKINTPLCPLSRGESKSPLERGFRGVFLLIGCIILLSVFYFIIPLPVPLFKPDYSKIVLDSNSEILRAFLNKNEQWCFPPNPDLKVPEKLKTAVLQYEDKHFYYHPGVNPIALTRAFIQNLKSREIQSGASTITMQVARLIKPKPRTYFNKFIEILQALKIELQYSKEEILSLYLNHAPYGSNIIGFQAASLRYFQKMPEELTWSQAATLAVLPNAPGLISPVADREKLKQKRNRLLQILKEKNIISSETYQLSVLEPIPETSTPFQIHAPHLAQYLIDRYDGQFLFQTTIDKDIQINTENLVKQQTEFLKNQGIYNGTALVVETQTGKIRAYVGSQDFFDFKNKGQVNGVLAPRSSGSLLKPFLYSLCMDEGILLPQTKIKDVPSFYGSFSPANADLKYDGIVNAQQALIRSLNVPAVRLLYTYGVHPFYLFLKSAGVNTLFRSSEDYGLPLILGGAEVTVWDMARLFRGLGTYGQFQNLQILENQSRKNKDSYNLISQGACYLSLKMLKQLKRPGAEFYWEQYQNQWPLAWKTGTSYGQRDAWAVGVSPQWTISVWIGNFSGEGNANLAGAKSAGPLLFDIFNSLPKTSNQTWFEEPTEDLQFIKICAETGYQAGPNCEHTTMVEAPKNRKSLKLCPYHKTIFVSLDEKEQVCSSCWEADNHKTVSELVYPPDVVQFLREHGQMINVLPPHKQDCPHFGDDLALQIIYPQENSKLWIPRDFDGHLQQVTMKVAHRDKDQKLFWYLDDHYSGSSEKNPTKAMTLSKGWHELEVVDEIGNRDRTRFFVDLKGN
jgi:penicillin-binding protein 1C